MSASGGIVFDANNSNSRLFCCYAVNVPYLVYSFVEWVSIDSIILMVDF